MYSIADSYKPFLPFFIKNLRAGFDTDIEIGSSHAHEIVSAFFGYNTYAAAKHDRLHAQVGIFAFKGLPDNIQISEPDFTLAEMRIRQLLPEINSGNIRSLLSGLHELYKLEAGIETGYVLRMQRQLTRLYSPSDDCFESCAFMVEQDFRLSGEIVSNSDYRSFSWCEMPWLEIEMIVNARPNTFDDKLYQFNVDLVANILQSFSPNAIAEIRNGQS